MVGIGILVFSFRICLFSDAFAVSFKEEKIFAESTTGCFWWFIVAIQPIDTKDLQKECYPDLVAPYMEGVGLLPDVLPYCLAWEVPNRELEDHTTQG